MLPWLASLRKKFLGGAVGTQLSKQVENNPYVEGATVEATVEKQGKERKVTIYKYNAKKHYHKKQGHRQPYTKLIVDAINVK